MGFAVRSEPQRRGYNIASTGRLGNWGVTSLSADAEIRMALRPVRAKSRHLAANNDYVKQFFRLLKGNVVGPAGITMQNKSRDERGALDKNANDRIEAGWKAFCKRGQFDVTGKLSGRDGQKLFIEGVAKDGEALVRMVFGYPNEWGFALQFLEPDHLDENLNKELANGHRIRMGIEYDAWDRPVAYWLLKVHPGDYGFMGGMAQKYERIPAEEIIHEFPLERARQGRGMPWIHTCGQRLQMLDGFEEAAVTAARVGASKMGFFEESLEGPGADEYTGEEDEDGDLITEAEPATFEKLPPGVTFKEFDPGYPTGDLEPFVRGMLRGSASGLGVSYHSLANDLTGVSFSSIRAGTLIERDIWRDLQGWMIEAFLDRVFSNWLRMALLSQAVRLPMGKIARFNAPVWRARGWDWVDPLKDQTANKEALKAKTKTHSEVLAERGLDFEDTMEQLAEEKKIAASYGIDLDAALNGGSPDAKAIEAADEKD